MKLRFSLFCSFLNKLSDRLHTFLMLNKMHVFKFRILKVGKLNLSILIFIDLTSAKTYIFPPLYQYRKTGLSGINGHQM